MGGSSLAWIIGRRSNSRLTRRPSETTTAVISCPAGNDQIADSLMVAFYMIVRHELPNGCSQRILSEQDYSFQTGFLNGANETFGVAVQVR
jgi:hypothetical protein